MQNKLVELEKKLEKYKAKLAEKSLGFGEVVRTRFGDSYEDQLRDDTNTLQSLIGSIEEEIKKLKENLKHVE